MPNWMAGSPLGSASDRIAVARVEHERTATVAPSPEGRSSEHGGSRRRGRERSVPSLRRNGRRRHGRFPKPSATVAAGPFLTQLDAGHLELALTYAAQLRGIHLADALRILGLMTKDDDHRFSRAASRWVERFGAETAAGFPRSSLRRRRSDCFARTQSRGCPLATLPALLPSRRGANRRTDGLPTLPSSCAGTAFWRGRTPTAQARGRSPAALVEISVGAGIPFRRGSQIGLAGRSRRARHGSSTYPGT